MHADISMGPPKDVVTPMPLFRQGLFSSKPQLAASRYFYAIPMGFAIPGNMNECPSDP
jgi:hypothetical protein